MNLQFIYPENLFLLWLAIPLFFWWRHVIINKERRLAEFVSPAMQSQLRPPHSRIRFTLQAIMLCLALMLAVVATARPQWGKKEEKVFTTGRDIVIAIDVSRSMLATDVHPNRLERAKTDLMDLIKTFEGDRGALLAFRNGSKLICPLTTDYSFLKQTLDNVDIFSAPRGPTDLSAAIFAALDVFESGSSAYKAIVLISDGEDLTGKSEEAAQKAAEERIPVYAIGFGATTGSLIPDPDNPGEYLEHNGEKVRSSLNNNTMRQIAEITDGAYIGIGTAQTASVTLGQLYKNYLRKISVRSIEEKRERMYIDRYQYFLFPAVLLLLATAYLSSGTFLTRKKKSHPFVPKHIALAFPLMLSICPTLLHAETNNAGLPAQVQTNAVISVTNNIPPGRGGGRIAQKLYSASRFNEAADAYLQAAEDATGEMRNTLRYNAAISHYKSGKHEKAANLLRQLSAAGNEPALIIDKALASVLYQQAEQIQADNTTNATLKAELLTEAAETFSQALRDDPENNLIRHDTSLAAHQYKTAKQEAKRIMLLEKYGKQPPSAIMGRMLNQERELINKMQAAFTNNSPGQIYQLEKLANEQDSLADLWIPLNHRISSSPDPTNSAAAANLEAFKKQGNSTEKYMRETAQYLEDINPEAYKTALHAEGRLYNFWKQLAEYSQILDEDIRRQTNAILLTGNAESKPADNELARMEQEESAELTYLFSDRFKTMARPAPHSDTTGKNGQPEGLTPEIKQQILQLASQAGDIQKKALSDLKNSAFASAKEKQTRSYEILQKIKELLPRNKQQQDQPKQDKKSDNQQSENKDQKQDKQGHKQEPQEDQPEPQDQEPEPQENQTEEKSTRTEKHETQKNDAIAEDSKKIMERAIQRQREHEQEKRKRRSQIPLQAFEKDW